MLNIIEYINLILGNYKALLTANIFSCILQIYILVIIIILRIKINIPKKKFILILGILIGSIINIFCFIIAIMHDNSIFFNFEKHVYIRAFCSRIGWAFFVIHNQSLIIFIESLIERNFKLRKRHIVTLTISGILMVGQFYIAFFKFNIPNSKNYPWLLTLEQTLVRIISIYLVPVFIPTIYKALKNIREKAIPKILSHQLKVFIGGLIVPYLTLELITKKLLLYPIICHIIPINREALLTISRTIETFAILYSCKKIIGLRFLNITNHVESRKKLNFINNFKDILAQLSKVTNIKELMHITQNFFHSELHIPKNATQLYVRKMDPEQSTDSAILYHNELYLTKSVESFLLTEDRVNEAIFKFLRSTKVLIKDEIEFSNFYDENITTSIILEFMQEIKADIFTPIFEKEKIIAYIIVESNTRPEQLFNGTERDEMLVFASYISNTINILRFGNLDILLKTEKELKEELYYKHQEIGQFKESIRSFLRTNKERKIGILFYKNKKFTFANQAAHELINFDINIQNNNILGNNLKQIAKKAFEYKSSQTMMIKDNNGSKLLISAIPSLEPNNIIIILYYPEISDIIKTQLDLLKDPSVWDYVLYLETTKSGQLINQLIPGNGEVLLNFKINLLSIALSKKATLIDIPEDDILATVEIIHHITLKQTLHILKLNAHEKNNDIAIKLFGLNPIFGAKDEAKGLLEQLDNIGTLFIQNIHFLSLETQQLLSEFISYGFYRKFKSDHKIFSNLRIICSSTKNLQTLIAEGLFNKNLFNELNKATLIMPSLQILTKEEAENLAQGFTEQALKTEPFKNLLELNDREKDKLLSHPTISLNDLKNRINQVLTNKSNKNKIHTDIEFDPAYHIVDPEIAQIVRMGKKALKDSTCMKLLWQKFQNQNKIATLLGVNRSSVNRRCREYKLIEEHE